ncbi:MAG: protein translocase subunit SecD [Candidatus Roizmanbacteria bacterium]|nr:MAG: protein translocase subunit SecD [Candidatus Roizmanbacteria bacterium]
MRILKVLIPLLLLLLIIWIDLPENNKIPSLTIDTTSIGINFRKEFKTHLGLDLKGGSHLVFDTDMSKVKANDINDALNSARDIIEKRVNFFGVSEPSVQTIKSEKNYRISVDLPGITNTSEAVQVIGQIAQLSFKEEATGDAKLATAPAIFRLTKETGLTGRDVKKATVAFDPQTGKPQVKLDFTSEGTKKFGNITSRNVGKQISIFIDQFPISAPVVQQPITDGNAVITGNFTVEEAKKLAVAINSGALPIPIKMVEQRSIGPTLGSLEVKKSVYAGVAGLTMVMIFMILYYKRLGLIACMALLIYGLISLAIFKTIPVVLTLPGVAGFILSIGMAVDSNILIFERIKEELRKGRDFDIAIRLGFGRAIDAIKDANITTLLVAFILFNPLNWDFLPQFGLVRGFALTLAIGVITSLFTGVVITKRLINIFYKK